MQVYVNLTDIKRFENKITELQSAVKRRISTIHEKASKPLSDIFLEEFHFLILLSFQSTDDTCQCFISYAWANSHRNARNSNRSLKSSALGWEKSDPRFVKDFLCGNGIKCWLDIEQTGKVITYRNFRIICCLT